MYTELLLMSHLNNWKNGANYFQKQFSLDPDLFFWWKVSLLCFGPCWLKRGWPRQWSKHKVSFIIQKTRVSDGAFHIFSHIPSEERGDFLLENSENLLLQMSVSPTFLFGHQAWKILFSEIPHLVGSRQIGPRTVGPRTVGPQGPTVHP